MKVRFVDIGGIRTRYYVAGAGKPLLLIHGVGSSADSWVRCIERLGEGYAVYAPDLIGHGFSDAVDFAGEPPQTIQLHHLFDFVDAMGLASYAIAGASFGGLLAALMYFARPNQVDKLVLIGSGSVFNPAEAQIPVLRAVLANQIGAAQDPTPESVRARNAGSTWQKRDGFEEIVLTLLTSYALPDRVQALRQTVEGLIATVHSPELRVYERLEQITVPTLIVTGREDPRADWKYVEAGHRRMPSAVMRVFEHCGHKPYSEYPRDFSEAVLEFLA